MQTPITVFLTFDLLSSSLFTIYINNKMTNAELMIILLQLTEMGCCIHNQRYILTKRLFNIICTSMVKVCRPGDTCTYIIT